MAPQDNDSRNLLELAVDIHTDLGKLSTGLAHAGANPQAVASLQRMGGILAEVAKLLGAGPTGQAGQHGEPAGASAAPVGPEAAPPGAAPAAGPVAAPGGPPAGAPQGVTPGERPSALHEATQHLQAALAASKQRTA